MIETGLQSRVVIVTGAANGIGRATASRFVSEGCTVAAWDLTSEGVPPGTVFQRVDVTVPEQVNAAVEHVCAQLGKPYVLINNAGVLRDGQLVRYKDGELQSLLSDQQFDSVVSVNLRGVFLCARATAPHMIAAGGGVILNAASVVGLYGNFGQTNYVASKAGVIGMTKVWARELGKYAIRVNAVAPGFIATEMIRDMPPKVLDGLRDRTPLRRIGQAEDVANAYLWLASDAASFISGTVLSVDGGAVTGT